MVEIKVGQKWKSTDWWANVAEEKTVEITAIEGDIVHYVPGMISVAGGHDDAGLDTWEERWELVEDVVENKFKVGQVWYSPVTEANNKIEKISGGFIYYEVQPLDKDVHFPSHRRIEQTKGWVLVSVDVEEKEKPVFNVGDKVRTLCAYAYLWKEGEEGVIQHVGASGTEHQVYFPGQNDWWWLEASKLELIEEEVNDFDPVDNVNHPAHYTNDPSGVECIEITRHRNFNIGNAIKYLWRAGLKQDSNLSAQAKEIEDLKKAVFYIQDEIAKLES